MNFFLFQILPYLAVLIMAAGGIYRLRTAPYTVSSKSSQLLEKRGMKLGSNLFHIGILGLLLGHIFGLFTPQWVLEKMGIPYAAKQTAAVILGGALAVLCLTGLLILIVRRFGAEKVSRTSSFGDRLVVLLIAAQLVVGLITLPYSLRHPNGSETLTFMAWANGLARFDFQAWLVVSGVDPVFKLHFLLGMAIFATLPFTRLIHIFRIPAGYLFRPYLVARRKI